MARRPVPTPEAAAIRALVDARGRLQVRVTPGAKSDEIRLPDVGSPAILRLRIRAAAIDGRANVAVLKLLGAALDIAPGRLQIVRGLTSRDKLIAIA